MAWLIIFIAGLFEVVWAVGLKYTDGFTKIIPSIWTIAAMIISMYLLSKGAKVIPIGTAYAVWTGIGAVGAVIFGIIFLGEPRDISRIIFLGLIITGIIGLKLCSKC